MAEPRTNQSNLARNTFVGRERELAELRGALDDADSGRGRLFLISGEPGIGKTRLASELAAEAASRGMRWRNIVFAAFAWVAIVSTSVANATITQGDFSVFGFFASKESGRWGEGGAKDGTGVPATYTSPISVTPFGIGSKAIKPGSAATESGGSFDFNRWDLVQARQLGDIRAEYHIVKSYTLLGRIDTLALKDADFFAFYRPWYDAFGTLKRTGRAETNRDWTNYSQRQLQEHYFRNDLREFYAQLNFTDNFSMRVGKQQVIWSEADALSGTEVTNPSDLRFHWDHFETDENLRRNVRMVKFNYILPDFLNTTNNEAEAFVIPGDYQGDVYVAELDDVRSPWIVPAAQGPNLSYNRWGQPFRQQTNADQGQFASTLFFGLLAQGDSFSKSNTPSNSLDRSEFGIRYSTLLPIGNGLQASFIYLYEARDSKNGFCTSCPTPRGFFKLVDGIFFGPGHLDFGPPPAGAPLPFGTLRVLTGVNYRRNHFIGVTGTYYEKNLTDMVFRYDAFFSPKAGINIADGQRNIRVGRGESGSRWTEQARFILTADRPTYIPWISKQHTFLVGQYINSWLPDLPGHAVPNLANAFGKVRRFDDLFFLAAVNWIYNGQLTTTNVFVWDIDDKIGFLESDNMFRYSRNVLFGLNAIWYLGRSARNTDPFTFSRSQRINEVEAVISYEI